MAKPGLIGFCAALEIMLKNGDTESALEVLSRVLRAAEGGKKRADSGK